MNFILEKATVMYTEHWVHNLSPFLWEIAPGIGVRWYGLAYFIAFVLAFFLFKRWTKEGWLNLNNGQITDFVMWLALGTVVGGRLGYCFFYAWQLLMADPFFVLRVWEGGMSSHGGILGLIVAVWWFAKRQKLDFWRLGDAVALAAPLGVVFGRLANFINGELWGRPSTVPWAVIFPASGDFQPRHPYPIYAALLEGAAVWALGMFLKYTKKKEPGGVMWGVIFSYCLMRTITEFFREPDGGKYWMWNLTQGQWFTILLFVVAVLIFLLRKTRSSPQKPNRFQLRRK